MPSFAIRRLLVMGMFLLVATSSIVSAAPRANLLPPTSQLLAVDAGLVLIKEDLRLACDEQQCKVVVACVVNAPAATTAEFIFFAPRGVRIVSMVNGMPELARVAPLPPSTTSADSPLVAAGYPDLKSAAGLAAYRSAIWSPRVLGDFVVGNDLVMATFTARLQGGSNNLSLTYDQAFAWFETASGGRRVSLLQYELWPLAQWTRDSAFMLRLDMRLKRPVPGWWQSHFGRVLNLDGYAATLAGVRTPLDVTVEQVKDDLVLRKTFVGSIPERLVFVVGESRDLEASRRSESLVFP